MRVGVMEGYLGLEREAVQVAPSQPIFPVLRRDRLRLADVPADAYAEPFDDGDIKSRFVAIHLPDVGPGEQRRFAFDRVMVYEPKGLTEAEARVLAALHDLAAGGPAPARPGS